MTLVYSAIALITVFIVLVFAAKRRGGRRRPLQPIKFSVSVPLSTLADVTVITGPTVTLQQDFHVISTHMTIALKGLTAGEGPLDVGLAAGLYSVTEIAEAIDASPTSQFGPEMERSQRKVRHYGTFPGNETEEVLNDGEKIARRMFLRGPGGTDLADCWVRNNSGATLTTGAVVEFTGVHWGRWK